MSNTLPIVGAYYRPPAQAIINALAVGTPLYLEAEPDNPADTNAIAVWLRTEDIPPACLDRLEAALPENGHSLETLQERDIWQLGYIPKNFAAQLKAAGWDNEAKVEVEFAVATNGGPLVRAAEPFNV